MSIRSTEFVDLLLPDLSGVLRGKRLAPSAIRSALADEAFFTTTVYSIDTPGANVAESGMVWEEGDADRPLRLDAATLAPSPGALVVRRSWAGMGGGRRQWLSSPTACTCWPRSPLSLRHPRPAAQWTALEFEFYLIDQELGEHGAPLGADFRPTGPSTGRDGGVPRLERIEDRSSFFELVQHYCEAQDLPIKGAFRVRAGPVRDQSRPRRRHGAGGGPGCHAQALQSRPRLRGDRLQRATFMAKPFADQSGSGLHIHLSLLDRDGRNLFGETPDGERHLRHAVRGLQDLMAESMLVFAPNANSFRRLRPLTYAPTAATWGWNNRTVALRVPPGGPAARRIEHRVAGSDANPYLVLAVVLAGVLEGLESRQEPNEPIVGNAYANSPALLPLSWDAAIAAFRAGEHLPRWFGERFCRLFAAVRQGERDRFHSRVTPTEYEWYLTTV